ncbi:hypothetical protein [Clostridium sp. BNL1100]|uniref:hypothetical protein n=1 Tax=Clostridium sp. BNL1100 TaxID=755731 RepID=UPI00024A7F04|nr:hypothetical protein [Clostridium sp. BNL1100]AEY65405.1 hypothetical protein Clo1100_1153 [Clostridium sp. BNL1100]
MSSGIACTCESKDKNNWRIRHYRHNHSAFEHPKYAEHYSDRSTIICLKCHGVWRTKASYVEVLKHEGID